MKNKVLHVVIRFLHSGVLTILLFLFFETFFTKNSLHWQFLFYCLIMGSIAGLMFVLAFFMDYYLKKHIRSYFISFLARIVLCLIIYFPYNSYILIPIEIIFSNQMLDGFYNFWMQMPLLFLIFFFFNINRSALDKPVL